MSIDDNPKVNGNTPSRVLPSSAQAQATSIDNNPKADGSAAHGLNP